MSDTVYLIRFNQKKDWQSSCKRYYGIAASAALADKMIAEAQIKYPAKLFWKRICTVMTE